MRREALHTGLGVDFASCKTSVPAERTEPIGSAALGLHFGRVSCKLQDMDLPLPGEVGPC